VTQPGANAGSASDGAVPARALDDLRVLDLSTSMAGAWCSRLLADFGADVVTVEPRWGHPLRQLAPFTEEGRSIPALYAQANKRSVALDIENRQAQTALVRLATRSHVVIESASPDAPERAAHEAVVARNPKLIYASITPHGQDGGYASLPGNDLTVAARSGWASVNGAADRDPVSPSSFQGSYCAGAVAYGAIVSALCHLDAQPDEDGQRIDVSELEVMASTFAPALLRGQYGGVAPGRRGEAEAMGNPVPVGDGHFSLTLSRAHFWRDAMNVLGLEDLADDEQMGTGWYRLQHRERWVDRVREAMAGWDRRKLFDELAVRRVVAGPVFMMAELAENEHLRERGFFGRPEDDADGGRGAPEYPGAPFKMSATPASLRRSAPKHGWHTLEVLREVAGFTDDQLLGMLEAGAIGSEAAQAAAVAMR
jgi:crotonobetainyl-CoA:carnitine CoA-transferase CaiB-like acyl-CoA transferase